MKVSTRINGRVTSINVRNTVCALHQIICGDPNGKNIEGHILDTCHGIISTWKGATGKGLSGYITDKMLEDLIDTNDLELYNTTLRRLENG